MSTGRPYLDALVCGLACGVVVALPIVWLIRQAGRR